MKKTKKSHSSHQYFQMHWKLFTAAICAAPIMFFLPSDWKIATRILVGWDSAVLIYLMLTLKMMLRCNTTEQLQKRAQLQDEGRIIMLLLTSLSATFSLGAIFAELSVAQVLGAPEKYPHVILAAGTVVLSWIFMQTIFALHYAHEYYSKSKDGYVGGLEFKNHTPADKEPDYWDFMYFSFVIGTSTATSDTDVTSRHLRRISGLHCVIAFFFNTTILALAINIGAGLLS